MPLIKLLKKNAPGALRSPLKEESNEGTDLLSLSISTSSTGSGARCSSGEVNAEVLSEVSPHPTSGPFGVVGVVGVQPASPTPPAPPPFRPLSLASSSSSSAAAAGASFAFSSTASEQFRLLRGSAELRPDITPEFVDNAIVYDHSRSASRTGDLR